MDIKNALKEKEKSLRKIALEIDMPYSTLSDIANKKVDLKKCSYENLSKVADYLETTVEDVVKCNEYNFIDDTIKLDSRTETLLKDRILEIEEADKNNDYGTYNALVEPFVYTVCKNLYADKKLTKEQWNRVQGRYLL